MIKFVTAMTLGFAMATAGIAVTQALADQPMMQAALESLREAHQSLQGAEADKGGHRVRAMNLVEQAIAETEAGIAFAAGQ